MDLPRPAGEKSQATPFVTHERMGKNVGVQRKVLARVIGVEKRVGNNEKKITLLKNIIKTHQSNLGEKLASLSGGGLAESVQNIADTVSSISNTLLQQQTLDKAKDKDAAIEDEQKKRNLKEKLVEGGKNLGKGILKQGKKALAPVMSAFERIKEWLIKLIMAKSVMMLIDWFGDPENQSKITSIFRFIKDWWPAILTGLLLFAGSILGPGGMILAAGALVVAFIPKLVSTVKTLLGFGESTEKDAKNLEQKAIKAEGKKELEQKPETGPKEVGDAPEPGTQPFNMFNKGGEVPGSGSGDTVPAMLTPGEFVMNKGAVSHWGKDTLEGMNAAAGGTNKPEGGAVKRYAGGGEVKKPEGLMRGLTGAADFMTGGLFDFDKQSGGGHIEKVIGGVKNMVGNVTGGGNDIILALEDLHDRIDLIDPTTINEIIGPKAAEAGNELVSGVQTIISKQHEILHKVVTPANVSAIQNIRGPVGTPSKPTTTVAYADAKAAAGGPPPPTDAGGKIPDFDPSAKVSPHKVKLLGISR